jgi:hypothetical protein
MAGFSDLLTETFSFPYQQNFQYAQIQLSSSSPEAVIKKIYLYRCKNLDPVQCVKGGIQPVISTNPGNSDISFDETYRWDDVSSSNVGNFLTMVKIDMGGREFWTGSWDKITKTGIRNFYHENYFTEGIDVHLDPGVSAAGVKSYIESYNVIPADDVNRTVFGAVSGSAVNRWFDLYGSKDKADPSGTGVPSFYATNASGGVFGKSLGIWDFVFAGTDKISSPVAFYSTSAGAGPGPGPGGGARMIIDSWSPQVVSCGGSDVITVNLHADNSSAGYFQSYYYKIGSAVSSQGAITCSIVNPAASIYAYQCSIPVASMPVCSAPGTATISVYFTYEGGAQLSASFPVTLQAPAPRLTVSSLMPSPFDCGLDKQFIARLGVSNPLSDPSKKFYSVDGSSFTEMKNCTGSGGSYSCSINESAICNLLQENLEMTFKVTYGSTEVISLPSNVMVTFPPPSMGIDIVTPQSVQAGSTTIANVILHVNYPNFLTYNTNSFNFKYLDKGYVPVTCTLQNSYTNIKYYTCPISLAIPAERQGVETLSIRLDGFRDGVIKQLTANAFFEILPPPAQPSLSIVSVSPSPLSCIQDSSLVVSARAENVDGTPTTQYSADGGKTYKPVVCSQSGSVYACTISKDNLCGLMSASLTLMLKFTYSGSDLISNPQNVYVTLPEPHMQVYSVSPDTLGIGATTTATVNLFVQYPQMVGSNPVFLYSYLSKTNQRMTCSKVSSTSNRDFYECANTQFEIPSGYAQSSLPVLFSIQGSTISFPVNLPVSEVSRSQLWLEIVSSDPSRIEMSQGNETSASFYVTVHNAAENGLKHQATLLSNSWVSAGTCSEADVQYDFECDATIKAAKTAKVGETPITITLRTTDGKTYDVSNTTSVFVTAEQAGLEVQSISPETLYCSGQSQQNPASVRVTARATNLASFTLLEEDIIFNGGSIAHTAKYCTQQGQSITCNVPTDKFMEKVGCGSGDLVPGGGTHYYPLSLSFLLRSGDVTSQVAGSKDVAIVARPLEAYIEVTDNDVVDGTLQTKINCLGSQVLKLGDSGDVRIMYADLLHPEPKDDLTWSFRLDAQDDKGKLTKGMGVSPTANATICKLKDYQMFGNHRLEDYECSLYVDYGMFQRCDIGEGDLIITASASSKKAEGVLGISVFKDDSKYQFDFDIITTPTKNIDCQIQSYGSAAPCSIASYSSQNVTIRVYNNNEDVGLADLTVYDFDAKFEGASAGVTTNERSLGNCIKDSKDSEKYLCPFQIDPVLKLPATDGYNVTKQSNQTDFPPFSLGSLNITIYVRYANGLEKKPLSKLDGTITIHPKKTDSMINAENMLEKMHKTFDSFIGIFKWVVMILSFCAVCTAGNTVVDNIKSEVDKMQQKKCKNVPPCPKGQACQNGKCEPLTTTKTSGNQTAGNQKNITGTGTSEMDTKDIIGSIAVTVGLVLTTMYLFGMLGGGDDPEKAKSDIMDSMKSGLKWGLVTCVLPRIVGEIGGWIVPKDSGWKKGFEGVSAVGKGMNTACRMLFGIMPTIMNFIQFYIRYLQFEMCMQVVEAQVEASANYGGSTSGQYADAYQAQVQAQTAAGMAQSMMTCFNQFGESLQSLTNSMAYMGNYMGTMGGMQTYVRFYLEGTDIGETRDICGTNKTLTVQANLCEGGVPSQSINIIGSGCRSMQSQGQCIYTMPTVSSSSGIAGSPYGAPGYGTGTGYPQYGGYGFVGGSPGISAPLPLADCQNGQITVTFNGAGNVQPVVFNFKRACSPGQSSTEESNAANAAATQLQNLGIGKPCYGTDVSGNYFIGTCRTSCNDQKEKVAGFLICTSPLLSCCVLK